MKTKPQITIVEPRMMMPVWRSASPKNWKTRPVNTSPATRAEPEDLADRVQPTARDRKPAGVHLITCSSGWVASRVW